MQYIPKNTDTASHLITLHLYFSNQLLPLHSRFSEWKFHILLKNNDFPKRGLILLLVSEHTSFYLSYSNQFNSLPSPSNNSANPSASYSTRNARSFSPWIWYGVTVQLPELQGAAFPTAHPLLPLPCRRFLACLLLVHLPKSKILILIETETPGSFNAISKNGVQAD